jgi:iron complex transport system substrate-binding protein
VRNNYGKGIAMRGNRRFLMRLLPLLVALAVFVGCATTGRTTVVSLSAPLAETVYALGASDQLLCVTDPCVFPEQLMEDRHSGKVRVVGGFIHIDTVLVDSLKPDLILTSTDFQEKIAEQFRARGYKVLHYSPKRLEDVFQSIEEIGEALGKGALARQLTAGYRAEIQKIYAKASTLPKVRVYMEINHIGPWTVGSHSPLNDLIEAAGGENIFADTAVGVFVTTHEEIIRRNPDVILSPIWINAKIGGYDGITLLAEIYSRNGYDKTNAVQNSRVLYYDSALLKHEGPRQVLAVQKLAHLLHPEAFEDPEGTIPWELGKVH